MIPLDVILWRAWKYMDRVLHWFHDYVLELAFLFPELRQLGQADCQLGDILVQDLAR